MLPFDTVRPDLFSAMFDAWQRARAFGSRRIGVVIPSSIIARENELLLSACAYHMRELPESPPPLILQPDAAGGMAHYQKQTLEWYHMHRPEGVIGKTDGAYWALHQGGKSCPGDFRFISLHLSDPPGRLSGYHWPARKLAEAMAERLHSLISLGGRGPRDCPGIWSLPCTWQEGGTF